MTSLFKFGKYAIRSSQIFHRTQFSVCLVNLMPAVEGHVLVTSERLVPKLKDLTSEEVCDLFLVVQKVSKLLEHVYEVDSLTVCIQDGPKAGQTVEHVHVHVLPRRPGDFKRNDDVYDAIDQSESQRERRSEEDMARESSMLREQFAKLKL